MYREEEIRAWARRKGIYDADNFTAQIKGIAEETVEVAEEWGHFQNDEQKRPDLLAKELGDIYVWWINACYLANITPETAIELTMEKILKRSGKMKGGRFVKD